MELCFWTNMHFVVPDSVLLQKMVSEGISAGWFGVSDLVEDVRLKDRKNKLSFSIKYSYCVVECIVFYMCPIDGLNNSSNSVLL